MTEDDVALERFEIGSLDADARQLSEARVDAVDRLTLDRMADTARADFSMTS